jgi:hypothetical protein
MFTFGDFAKLRDASAPAVKQETEKAKQMDANPCRIDETSVNPWVPQGGGKFTRKKKFTGYCDPAFHTLTETKQDCVTDIPLYPEQWTDNCTIGGIKTKSANVRSSNCDMMCKINPTPMLLIMKQIGGRALK